MFSDFDTEAAAAGRLVAPDQDVDLRFKVMLKGQDVGEYTFAVRPSGHRGEMAVAHAFVVRVKFGFITAFQYEHKADETWSNGQLQRLVSQTNDNGDTVEVEAERSGSRIHIQGPGGPSVADGNRLTTTCAWHPAFVSQTELIDAIDGSVVGVVATEKPGAETPETDDVPSLRAYDFISPHFAGTLWYLQNGSLVKAAFERKGHQLSLIEAP